MQVRDTLIANPSLNGKKNIYLSCVYETTFISDTIENSRREEIIDLSGIDKKNRLAFIDQMIYDMKSKDTHDGVRIYEVEDIDDIKNIPDQIPLIIEDFNTETNKLISQRLVKKWKKMNQLISDSDTTFNQIYSLFMFFYKFWCLI